MNLNHSCKRSKWNSLHNQYNPHLYPHSYFTCWLLISLLLRILHRLPDVQPHQAEPNQFGYLCFPIPLSSRAVVGDWDESGSQNGKVQTRTKREHVVSLDCVGLHDDNPLQSEPGAVMEQSSRISQAQYSTAAANNAPYYITGIKYSGASAHRQVESCTFIHPLRTRQQSSGL